MRIKGIIDEDFINYKVPSMYIATATCSFKCDREYGQPICQNSELAKQPDIIMSTFDIVDRYLNNPITHAIVFGGLEPFDQIDDVIDIIINIRTEPFGKGVTLFDDGRWNCADIVESKHPKSQDPIIIYTGYTKDEVVNFMIPDPFGINKLSIWFRNIIIKYGRYIPGQQPHYDPVLGVYLASDNQYAERIFITNDSIKYLHL